MSEPKIGEILVGQHHRDAIHFALAPVIAAVGLKPGEHIGVIPGTNRVTNDDTEVEYAGIVDPFLTKRVKPGEQFYMFLYVKTVTNMRHEWSHPAFPDNPAAPIAPPMSLSQAWIENYAESLGMDYETLMDGARKYVERQDFLNLGPLLEGERLDPEFWEHFEKITGKRGEGCFFSCSC